jgi:hypothetical protein
MFFFFPFVLFFFCFSIPNMSIVFTSGWFTTDTCRVHSYLHTVLYSPFEAESSIIFYKDHLGKPIGLEPVFNRNQHGALCPYPQCKTFHSQTFDRSISSVSKVLPPFTCFGNYAQLAFPRNGQANSQAPFTMAAGLRDQHFHPDQFHHQSNNHHIHSRSLSLQPRFDGPTSETPGTLNKPSLLHGRSGLSFNSPSPQKRRQDEFQDRPDVKRTMPSSLAYPGSENARSLNGTRTDKSPMDEGRPKNEDIFLNIARDSGRRDSIGRSDFRRVSPDKSLGPDRILAFLWHSSRPLKTCDLRSCDLTTNKHLE